MSDKYTPPKPFLGRVILKFDETEKVYLHESLSAQEREDARTCSCFVRVDYFARPEVDIDKGHYQFTLGEVFKFEPGKKYEISVREVE